MPDSTPLVLDAVDRKIVRLLLDDATLTNNDLADRVGLTAAPLSRRLARLQAGGVVRRAVVVEPKAVGLGLQAFVEVTLDRTGPEAGDRFITLVRRIPEVVECHTVAGDFDFLLKVSVRDVAAYKALIWTEFDRIPEIKTMRSTILLDTPVLRLGTLP